MSFSDHAQIRAHLAAIQANICALESRLAALHAEERTARVTLDSIVYPVDTLPTDVLIEIFQHYTGDPMLIATVCRQWWDAALCCPRLWPALPDNPGSNSQAFAHLLRARLARVGFRPLRIDTMLPASVEILSVFAPYFPQLLTLKLSVSTPNHIAFPEAPLLKELAITRPGFHTRGEMQIAFPSAPQLMDVCLSEVKSSEISLPWSQLTALRLSGNSLADGLCMIQLTPNLVTLDISARVIDHPPTIIELPHLRSLSMQCIDVLDVPKSPALENLSIRLFTQRAEPVLRNFAARSGCVIQKLHLRSQLGNNAGTLREAEACTRIFPTLCDFTLSGIPAYPIEWVYFLRDIASRSLLPAVHSLTFTDCAIPIVFISNMLAKRAQWEEGKVTSFRYIPAESHAAQRSIATLEELRLKGVAIDIGWGELD
ncbi:hypothetical protein FB45DRAFT_1057203 [Roridomyces roridus]|uniref:F-box domain-containing protein n=1 Tax=Roridomyces roridus TaxID=1738132 RepID=A0AAD7FP77_9AGAR|nr:hypothetical protein FB45DRAFT_1057203 [Roridomyces roridus]